MLHPDYQSTPKLAPALAAGARLLCEGGRLLATVPNGFGPFEIESWLSRLPVSGTASLWVVDHLVAVLNRLSSRTPGLAR